MVDGQSCYVVGEIDSEGSDTLRIGQGRDVLHWQRCAHADTLTFLSGDSLSLLNRLRGVPRCRNVVLRRGLTRRPAESGFERHRFAAQNEELSNVRLELRLDEFRGKVQESDENVILFQRLPQQVDYQPPVDGGELRQFVSGYRSVPELNLSDHRPR